MARDSLAKLVNAVDHDRAGKFSKAVPNRSTTTRQVCPACRQVPDYGAHRMTYEQPWRDHGWGRSAWEPPIRWVRKTAGGRWESQPYTYQRPDGCPWCGGALVEIEGG